MTPYRIALANLPFPESPDHSVAAAVEAIAEAGRQGAAIVCFPECFIPGYRGLGHVIPPPDQAFLRGAWSAVAAAAARSHVAVILGTERIQDDLLYITTVVFRADGRIAGVQDKVQLDPSEDALFTPGAERHIFQEGPLTFGIVICHEGWRYPETVRWAARRGAQIVFHPHYHPAGPKSFHEGAALCRAAENTCFFATVNCAVEGSPTTSAVARPDGTLLAAQPHGKSGLLIVEVDLDEATCMLASRCRMTASFG